MTTGSMTSTTEDHSESGPTPAGTVARRLGRAEPVAALALACLAAFGANQERWSLVLIALGASGVAAGVAAVLERGGWISYVRGWAARGALIAAIILSAWLYALALTAMAILRWVSQ